MRKHAPVLLRKSSGVASRQSAQVRSPVLRWTPLVAACVLAGCATYQPLPLEPRDTSPHEVRQLLLDRQGVRLPGHAPHLFDLSRPLDMTDVATLAVVGNPDLKLARDDAGLTHAQAFAAGLLPDPQIALSQDFPGKPGLVSAFNRGLSFDFGSLITLAARRSAGAAEGSKADLALLWQEWRVVALARKQFIGITFLERATGVLQQSLALTGQRVHEARQAVDAGNATLDSLSPYLVAQADAQRQLDDQTRQLHQARYALNALLGLAPEVRLDLALPPPQPALDTQAVRRALQDLPERRPDLLALAAGYHAQEERLRAAILAQFPSPNIGFTRARDTSAVYTSGFTLGISLPIFNRNRGNIAIETATRQRAQPPMQSPL